MTTSLNQNFGLEFAGCSLELVQEALKISDGRAKKLRDLHLLRPTTNSGRGKRERFNGFDVNFLASARQRPLPIDRPTLVCSMGVEPQHGLRPSLFFNRNAADNEKWIESCERELLKHEELEPLVDEIRSLGLFITGHWKVSDEDSQRLVDEGGIIVASYTGFILDGGRVIAEVPEYRRDDGARCFVVEPLSGLDQSRYCHNYRDPKVGPVVEVVG